MKKEKTKTKRKKLGRRVFSINGGKKLTQTQQPKKRVLIENVFLFRECFYG